LLEQATTESLSTHESESTVLVTEQAATESLSTQESESTLVTEQAATEASRSIGETIGNTRIFEGTQQTTELLTGKQTSPGEQATTELGANTGNMKQTTEIMSEAVTHEGTTSLLCNCPDEMFTTGNKS
jgi:hypothetical protein